MHLLSSNDVPAYPALACSGAAFLASPEEVHLRLLPSGPDRVRSSPPRETATINTAPRQQSYNTEASRRNSTPVERVQSAGHRYLPI